MRLAALLLCIAATCALAAPGSVETLRRDVQRALKLRTASEQASAVDAACQGHDSPEAADALVDLVLGHDPPQIVLNVAMSAFARMEDQAVVAVLRRAAEEGPLARRVRAVEALSRCAASGAGAALLPLTANATAAVRAAAVTALGKRDDPIAVPSLETSLCDADWTVRSAAIAALSRLAARRSVPPLCEAMRASFAAASPKDGTGVRLTDDCVNALRNITGQRFGADPARYEAWWRREEKKELTTSAEWLAPPLSFESPVIGTRSRRIVFVLSTAETMKDAVPPAGEEAEVVRAVAKAGEDLVKDLEAAKTKLDVARVHLRAMIRTLKDGVEFDVMTYSNSPAYAFGKLTAADASSRKRAESRVASLSPGGNANLHAALVRLFDPRGKDPLTAEDGPDTIVLLTDGALAEPGSTDTTEVGAAAVRWNAVRQIRFLVVAVGQSDPAVLARLSAGPPEGASAHIP